MKFIWVLLALGACDSTAAADPAACAPPAPDTWKTLAPIGKVEIVRVGFIAVGQLWAPTRGSGGPEYSRFDPCTSTWTVTPQTGGASDMIGTVVVAERKMFVRPHHTDVAVSMPITDAAWRGIESSFDLSGIFTWSGAELLQWQGAGRLQTLAPRTPMTGQRIDPARGTSRSISRKGAPSVRSNVVEVWAGDRWFVWGGVTGEKLLDDGATYDPAADRWTPISKAGAPSLRSNPSIAWTGSRVAVFGGARGAIGNHKDEGINDGALYDPRTDRWEPIASAKAIFGETLTSMHVAGPHLLVFNTKASAIYDLSTGKWTSIAVPKVDWSVGILGAPWPMWLARDGANKWILVRFDPVSRRWQTAKLPEPAASNLSLLGAVTAWVGDRFVSSWPASSDGKRAAGGIVGVPRWSP